jgi:hypothetical protein
MIQSVIFTVHREFGCLEEVTSKAWFAPNVLQRFADKFPPESLRYEDNNDGHPLNILHWLFIFLGAHFPNRTIDASWSSFIKYAISAGVVIHSAKSANNDIFLTPLVAFYASCARYFEFNCNTDEIETGVRGRRDLDHALQWIVNVLFDAGVDLVLFGAIESAIFRKNFLLFHTDWQNHSETEEHLGDLIVSHIVYGPKPCDWRFEYHTKIDDYAEEFWRMVELSARLPIYSLAEDIVRIDQEHRTTKTPTMPGMWVEYEEYYTLCTIIQYLVNLDLEDYEHVVELISGPSIDYRQAKGLIWWSSGVIVCCDRADCPHCALYQQVDTELLRTVSYPPAIPVASPGIFIVAGLQVVERITFGHGIICKRLGDERPRLSIGTKLTAHSGKQEKRQS